MADTNDIYRYYIVPFVGALTYLVLSIPFVENVFKDWIPDHLYYKIAKAVIIILILFITLRIIDLWHDPCSE